MNDIYLIGFAGSHPTGRQKNHRHHRCHRHHQYLLHHIQTIHSNSHCSGPSGALANQKFLSGKILCKWAVPLLTHPAHKPFFPIFSQAINPIDKLTQCVDYRNQAHVQKREKGFVPMKNSNLVGAFIRQKREALGLSQKSLGQLFNPAVTTQFVSNVERGITPLPTNHIPTVLNALKIQEKELMAVMEKEYVHKLSHKLGKGDLPFHSEHLPASSFDPKSIKVDEKHWAFFNEIYFAYARADHETQKTFWQVCQTVLKVQSPEQSLAEKKSA